LTPSVCGVVGVRPLAPETGGAPTDSGITRSRIARNIAKISVSKDPVDVTLSFVFPLSDDPIGEAAIAMPAMTK
jgi:hypothetical protein